MFELKIIADEPLMGVLDRIAGGLEAVAGKTGYDPTAVLPLAAVPTVGGVLNSTLPADPQGQPEPQEPEETGADGKRHRPTKEEMAAKRVAAKDAVEAAGLTLADVEKEIGAPLDKWNSKQCEKVHSLAAAAKPSEESPVPTPAETPSSADLVAQAKANAVAGKPNNEQQAKAIGEYQRALLEGVKATIHTKYTNEKTAEALFKAQMKAAYGVEHMHQATHTADFDANFIKLKGACDALPGDPPATAAVEPEVLPPSESPASDPANEARIAYISQFEPVGEKFTALTRDNIVTLLREGKPLGAEDVRAFCIATVSYGKLPGPSVNEIVRQFAPNVTALGPDQILPCIDALVAAANPQEAF